jgi:hypothetical protein
MHTAIIFSPTSIIPAIFSSDILEDVLSFVDRTSDNFRTHHTLCSPENTADLVIHMYCSFFTIDSPIVVNLTSTLRS